MDMSVLDIITYGHPTLRKKAEPYSKGEIDPKFVEDMVETMYKRDGVGLAAPQVNVSKQMLVATDFENEYILINPKIVARSEGMNPEVEGCLSIPGFQGEVERPIKVVVDALDVEGNPITVKARGFLARVLQHEIDHLNGILYIDRSDPDTLVRIENDSDSEDDTLIPVDLSDMQSIFRDHYHPARSTVMFDRQEKLS
jgi:peptide deformylase